MMDAASITHASNDELDRRALRSDLRRTVYKFQTMKEVVDDVEEVGKQSIIKGIFNWAETSAWVAPPGGMKSSLLASAAVHVAAGRDWFGRKTKVQTGVIYFALERADLVRRRLVAQARQMGINPETLNIMVVSEVIDLMNPETAKKIIALNEASYEFFEPPADWDDRDEEAEGLHYIMGTGLMIFDTHAKLIAAGGGDEDKAKDQNRMFANLQRVKDATQAHIALIGHTGKDETRGARGSNAFLGDVDLMVTITGDQVKTATVIKANDAPEGPLFSFKGEVYEFGKDEDGDPITVNIVSSEDVSGLSERTVKKAGWPGGLKLVRDCIADAVIAKGIEHQVGGDGPIVRAVEVAAARQQHLQRYVSNGEGDRSEAERKAWGRNFKAARIRDLICGEVIDGTELIWIVHEDRG